MFPSRSALSRSHRVSPLREDPGEYLERHASRLRAILEAGRFTIHDVVNDARVRNLVKEQWRVLRIQDEDLAIESYLAYIEYLDAVSRGELPRRARARPSLFSI